METSAIQLREKNSSFYGRIRKTSSEDIPQIKSLVTSQWPFETYDLIEHPRDLWLVVEKDGKIIGTLSLTTIGDLVHLESLVTLKQYRQHGVATALITYAYNMHVAAGQTLLAYVITRGHNIQLYKNRGFNLLNAKKYKTVDYVGKKTQNLRCAAMGITKE
jgi:N-acetylglutamate synthase-like GNAT family acetyltransferase